VLTDWPDIVFGPVNLSTIGRMPDRSVMMEYVLGFRFRNTYVPPDQGDVALILKSKPAWQAGKLNGIGGKVEPFDLSPIGAMTREFEEETGVHTLVADWQSMGKLDHSGHTIHLFKSFGDCDLRKTTDEEPGWYPVKHLGLLPVMRNLRWMVPFALDTDPLRLHVQDVSVVPS
jgi:8-oxo-dGTP diphosphatase